MSYIEVTFEGGSLRFVDTNRMSRKRVDGLFTKEPTTILWMDTFRPGDVMFDVGANVGMYSVYAAKVAGARVYSFEPESQNYGELNRNIFLNDLNSLATAYNVAASNEFDIAVLYVSQFCPGWSHHDFGENRWTGDKQFGSLNVKRDDRLQQGCVSIKLDDAVRNGFLPSPHHIKVDVDGFEWKVVEGAREILASPSLRSVLIETDFSIPESVAIIDFMASLGWKFSFDQMRVNQHEVVTEQTVRDRMRRKKGGQNIIYFKEEFYFDVFRKYAETFVPPNPIRAKLAAS